MARCRLDGLNEGETAESFLRYVPLTELDLWRHFMETRYGRCVCVEKVSIWIADHSTPRVADLTSEDLEPVLRICLELSGPHDVPVTVERFVAAEAIQAREALLSHFEDGRRVQRIVTIAGYFVRGDHWPGVRVARSA